MPNGSGPGPGEPEERAGGGGQELPGLRACIEAVLLVVDEPVPDLLLAQVLERPRDEVAAELRMLAGAYTAEGRGFDLREVAGGGGCTPGRHAPRWSSGSSPTAMRSG